MNARQAKRRIHDLRIKLRKLKAGTNWRGRAEKIMGRMLKYWHVIASESVTGRTDIKSPTTLEMWSFVMRGTGDPAQDLFLAPECRMPAFQGWVFNHKNQHPKHSIFSGRWATTSELISYDAKKDVFVTSSGSRYRLGVVDPDYDRAYPNSKQRLIEIMSNLRKGV